MNFLKIFLFCIANCYCYEWDNSILQYPPWKLDHCDHPFEDCFTEEAACPLICDLQTGCNINVAIILANQTDQYIVTVDKAISRLREAEEAARGLWIIPENIKFTYLTYDDRCKQEFATIRVISATSSCAHVIFGPACDYCLAAAGRTAKYLGNHGMPVITPVGYAFDFTDAKTNCSNEYYMVVNSGPVDSRSFAEFFHLIRDRYEWQKVVLMYEKDKQQEVSGEASCQFVMKAVMEEFKHEPGLQIKYEDGDLVLSKVNYSEFLKSTVGVRYGIILLCTAQQNVRQVALEAYKLGMLETGEYVIFNFEMFNNVSTPSQPWYDPNDTDENNAMAQKAYEIIYTFTPISQTDFEKTNRSEPGAIYLDAMYDGMLLYAIALNKSLNEQVNNITGYKIVENMVGVEFPGKNNETVHINCNAQRVAKYALMQLNHEGYNEIVAIYNTSDKNITQWNVRWLADKDPKDTPICGYDMSLCPKYNPVNILIISLVLVLCLGITVIGFILYRHFKLKAEIDSMAWKINYDDIIFLPNKYRSSFQSTVSLNRRGSQLTFLGDDAYSVAGDRMLYAPVGFYNGIRVAVKYLKEEKIELNHSELVELKVMKDLSNDNLVKFYGACIDIPNCILNEYCPKGSLQDILENESVTLDLTFKMSLIMDIVRGMIYLQNSLIKSHGALKSPNCLVDSRFVLKISDFGVHFLRRHAQEHEDDIESHSYWERQLWTAPELLRNESAPPAGTPKADVYSFGFIMHEILYRQGVFYLGEHEYKTAKEKVDAVRKGPDTNNGQVLRPAVNDVLGEEEVAQIMKKCWAEDPADRPDFAQLKNKLRQMNKESDGNLLDNLLARMEQYANNLESLVEERTADYLEQKRKCEELLYQLLPKSVAQQLITRESVIAEIFEHVTIHFSDIVGFTALSASSTPLQVVEFLNDLYTCFDSIIENFDVYKVETIGDSYMVVSGLPVRNGNMHAYEIARMSLALLKAVKTFRIRHRPQEKLKLRIGIHTGPCVAGVVGLKMPRYCLFGDTVNTASRMETNGLALKIHISAITKQFLDTFGTFDIEKRGEVEMKGKGKLVTYWLNGEIGSQSDFVTRPHVATPIPSPSKRFAGDGKVLNDLETFDQKRDESVPLLSITTPSEDNSNM